MSVGVCMMLASVSWAGPEAVQNLEQPAPQRGGQAVQFGFGGPNNSEFMLNGKPFQIRAGEMHPQRIPRAYWKHRIRMAKAMGLNTIAFYVFWNDLEQPDGTFDVKTGNRDIAAFLQTCQEEGMWVLFRPGPYVCGEWDLGGLPAYLLKKPNAKIRTTEDADFMKAQKRYLDVMAKVAEPYLAKNGGPILMTQLENEYGSYQRKDRRYMEWLLDYWTKKGFGPFYTSDGAGEHYLRGVVLPGVAVGLDPGVNDGAWNVAAKCNPGVPAFSSETYPGWLRHWGEGNWQPTPGIVNNVKWFMEKGRSFGLFVVHGGTNFGLTAGANNGGPGQYQPDLTSYDYGAPIDEQGRPNEFYEPIRKEILAKLPKEAKVPEQPAEIPSMEIPPFTPQYHAGLWDQIPKAFEKTFSSPPWFEQWGQNQGMAIYQTTIPAGDAADLKFERANDYAMVYVDGVHIGILDRGTGKKSLQIPKRDKQARLDILVEAMGHINFTIGMESDRKGLSGKVTLGDKELKNWKVSPFPLQKLPSVKAVAKKDTGRKGAFFRAIIDIDQPQDTFLDMSKYTKGYLWVNGHNMGRYWNIGPQLRLYVPATVLKPGKNQIDILDLVETIPQPVRGMKERNKEQGKIQTKNLNNAW